jgi:hypothetical protein
VAINPDIEWAAASRLRVPQCEIRGPRGGVITAAGGGAIGQSR